MGYNSFVARQLRPLPIIVLADTSGSMRGDKINELNLALRDMVSTLRDTDDVRSKFQVSVIAFGGGVYSSNRSRTSMGSYCPNSPPREIRRWDRRSRRPRK